MRNFLTNSMWKDELRLWSAVALQQITGWNEITCYTLMGLKSRWHWIQAERKRMTRALWLWTMNTYGWHCLRCGATSQLEADHVVSLFHKGETEKSNMQILCKRCNQSKGIKDADYRKKIIYA